MVLSTASAREPRIAWIDILRGLAIVLMVPANFSPYFAEPHAEWYRIFSSLAAPAFIALSGGLVHLRADRHTFGYYLKRGLSVVAIGMSIDAGIWGILPGTSYDVLYIIGISLPLMYLVRTRTTAQLLLLALVCFLLAPVSQAFFGYRVDAYEIYLNAFSFPALQGILASFFSDGWFPVFPWLGFSFLGAVLVRVRGSWPLPSLPVATPAVGPLLLLLGAAALYLPVPGIPNLASGDILTLRGGYSEIFYPAGIPYAVFASGMLVTAVTLFSTVPFPGVGAVLGFFGRSSMIVYIAHQALGKFIIEPWIAASGRESIESGWEFTLVTLVAFVAIALLCAGADLLRRQYHPRLVLLQTLLGR